VPELKKQLDLNESTPQIKGTILVPRGLSEPTANPAGGQLSETPLG
jgi:hypothetical protein